MKSYQSCIKTTFNAEVLSTLLDTITDVIGAQVLSRSKQNYQPHGASVTYMIADSDVPLSLVNHLTKSHICTHTYPETHPQHGCAIFRLDLDISTCGVISPLKVLNHLLGSLQWDVMTIDYKVRGFTRDIVGNKHYQDDIIENITDYLSDTHAETVEVINDNQPHLYTYHASLMQHELSEAITGVEQSDRIKIKLQQERQELFNAYR